MGANSEALTECLELSKHICRMGLGINAKRAACELYRQLVESSANLGAYITAADYVPTRSQRSGVSVDAMKEVSKVIYLLNVAHDSGMFIKEAVMDATKCAIKISSLLNGITALYMGVTSVADKAVDTDKAVDIEEPSSDPDGFDDPYTV